MLDSRFQVLNTLATELRRHGLEVAVSPETICIGRDQWDRYSQQILRMLSAAPAIRAGEKSFFLFATEQYDPNHVLVKYAIKLCDGEKVPLHSWDLDTKHGQHRHEYEHGEKSPIHVPHDGSVSQIAAEIMAFMRMHEPQRDQPKGSMSRVCRGLRMANAAEYAAWYTTVRGAWIGQTEINLLRAMIDPSPGESILDVGCGTGYFTARFAESTRALIVGLDPNLSWLRYARRHAHSRLSWLAGRAEQLPFPDARFDITVSVTALCFIRDQERALREIVRVTRRRFALGLLNRRSLLWWRKGRQGGTGSYRGARWHTVGETRRLISSSPITGIRIRTAVFLPGGGALARFVEPLLPACLPFGAFLAAIGDVERPEGTASTEHS